MRDTGIQQFKGFSLITYSPPEILFYFSSVKPIAQKNFNLQINLTEWKINLN